MDQDKQDEQEEQEETKPKKRFSHEFNKNEVYLRTDLDKDGIPSFTCKLVLSEIIQEVFLNGGSVPGMKLTSFRFDNGLLRIGIDSNRDGEESLMFNLDLREVFDEFKKKKK